MTDLDPAEVVAERLGDDHDLEACAVSADRRRALYAKIAGHQLFLLDLETGEPTEIAYLRQRCGSTAFLPDGRIAISAGGLLIIGEIVDGRLRRLDQIAAPPGSITSRGGWILCHGASCAVFGWAHDVLAQTGELEGRLDDERLASLDARWPAFEAWARARAERRAAGPVAEQVPVVPVLHHLIGPRHAFWCDRHPSGWSFGMRARGDRKEAVVGPGEELAICKPRVVGDALDYDFDEAGRTALVWSPDTLWHVDLVSRASRIVREVEGGTSCHAGPGFATVCGDELVLCRADGAEAARLGLPGDDFIVIGGLGGKVVTLSSGRAAFLIAIDGERWFPMAALDRAGFVAGWSRDGATILWIDRDETYRLVGLETGWRAAVEGPAITEVELGAMPVLHVESYQERTYPGFVRDGSSDDSDDSDSDDSDSDDSDDSEE